MNTAARFFLLCRGKGLDKIIVSVAVAMMDEENAVDPASQHRDSREDIIRYLRQLAQRTSQQWNVCIART